MKPLNEWLIELQKLHKLEISKVSFLEPHLFCFQVKLNFYGKSFIGFGSDKSKDIALTKAAAELSERVSVQFAGLNSSSGVAAHYSLHEAVANAQFELLERDALLTHWFFYSLGISLSHKLLSHDDIKMLHVFQDSGVHFEFKILDKFSGIQSVLCIALGSKARIPFGAVLGAGCSASVAESASKALSECAWSLASQLAGAHAENFGLSDFLKLKVYASEHHKLLALNKDYWQQVEIASTTHRLNFFPQLDCNSLRFETEVLNWPPELAPSPFVCVKANEPTLMVFEFGSCLTSRKIELAFHFKNFSEVCNLNSMPHVFG